MRGARLLLAVPLLAMLAMGGPVLASGSTATVAQARGAGYTVTPLVSDQPGHAKFTDPNLINAWGLVAGPSTPWWVAAADADRSTIYDGDGNIQPLVVKVNGGPTGTVFNGGAGFIVRHRGESGPSVFMFASEGGTILGWNPNVPPPAPSHRAFVVVDRSHHDALYKGLAIASTPGGDFLYAADFHNARIDVFNSSFMLTIMPGGFTDPALPQGYAPFGIQTIGDVIFVTYAKQDADGEEEVIGKGLGFVDAYDTSGNLLGRVASHGSLNAPWGLAMAPDSFGPFGGDLLVGNFGGGKINAFRKDGGSWVRDGALQMSDGKAIAIDGLWALEFGNGGPAGPTDTLYFTAGPDDETHGLFGRIDAG